MASYIHPRYSKKEGGVLYLLKIQIKQKLSKKTKIDLMKTKIKVRDKAAENFVSFVFIPK